MRTGYSKLWRMARPVQHVRSMSDLPASVHRAGTDSRGAERFVLLDGLRGVAAFAVIVDHVPGGWLGEVFPGRYLAVDFFFVLSGFVLAHAYGAGLASGGSPMAFMKARLIRLYPMYLLALMLALSLAVLGAVRGWIGPGWTDILTVAAFGLLFLPAPPVTAFGNGELYPANAPAWSLFFELVANLIYALIARVLSWRLLAAVLAIGAAAVTFTVFRHAGTGGPGWLWTHADAGISRVVFDFFAGVAIYRLRSVVTMPALPWWAAMIAFLGVIAVPATGVWRTGYDVLAELVLMPLLVMLASGGVVNGVVARLCAVAGLVSYAVYVMHVPLMGAITVAAAVLGVQLAPGPVLVLLVAVAAAGVAWLANALYDKPLRRWLAGRAKRAKPVAARARQG